MEVDHSQAENHKKHFIRNEDLAAFHFLYLSLPLLSPLNDPSLYQLCHVLLSQQDMLLHFHF